MTHKSLALALALGIVAAAGAPARAEDAGATISGAFTDAYEGLRDGILGAYETSTKGAVEKWNEITGKTEPVAQTPSSALAADVQRELVAAGYNPGPMDGRYGPMTGNAIRTYQHDNSLTQDGQVSQALLDHMQMKRTAAAGSHSALPQPVITMSVLATATWSEADCIGEWNFADMDQDGVVSGYEAGVYLRYQPKPGYGEISRTAFIASCRNGTLGQPPNGDRMGTLDGTVAQSSS